MVNPGGVILVWDEDANTFNCSLEECFFACADLMSTGNLSTEETDREDAQGESIAINLLRTHLEYTDNTC